jgi:hypothetical protein
VVGAASVWYRSMDLEKEGTITTRAHSPYRLALSLVVAVVAFALHAAPAAMVNYSGVLTENSFGPSGPLNDDFVIAGTFKPGFDVNPYDFIYGDAFGNLSPHHYTQAVADGNFRPIGSGTLADATGAFSGSGTATGIDGLPIWVFMFADRPEPQRLFFLALVSGTGPEWRVQNDGATTLDTATANVFHFGQPAGGGAVAMNVAPFPEPGSAAVLALFGGSLLIRRRPGSCRVGLRVVAAGRSV